MSMPLCSVIMPVYNREKYVTETVRSVLDQTYRNIELIVVDDHSQDSSYEIIRELAQSDNRILVIRHDKNEGCAIARNSALYQAKGEYIAFLDSDDIWHPEKLERQIHDLEQSHADLSYTAYTIIDSAGESLCNMSVPIRADFDSLLKNNHIVFSSICCRRQAVDGIFFNSSYYLEDYVFLLQLLQKDCIFNGLNEYLLKFRKHSGGRSFNKFNAAWQRWKICRHFLKLPLFTALFYFLTYALTGLYKYARFFFTSKSSQNMVESSRPDSISRRKI